MLVFTWLSALLIVNEEITKHQHIWRPYIQPVAVSQVGLPAKTAVWCNTAGGPQRDGSDVLVSSAGQVWKQRPWNTLLWGKSRHYNFSSYSFAFGLFVFMEKMLKESEIPKV